MASSQSLDEVLASLGAHLAAHEPELNRWAIVGAARVFLEWRAGALHCPDREEAREFLEELLEAGEPDVAFREYAFLLMAARHLWGRDETAHLSPVLREARVRPKPPRLTEWERAAQAISTLPPEWQPPFLEHLARSQGGAVSLRGPEPWSAAHIGSVARALARWADFCRDKGLDPQPTGAGFERYAGWLQQSGTVDASPRSIAHYLSRILSGYSVLLAPQASYEGARWVVQDRAERAAGQGPTTKTAAQVVPASTLYDLGFDLMGEARQTRFLGLDAARLYRNGLLIAVAAALPQRARALSALDMASTFRPVGCPLIEVRLPGRVLKMRQRFKATSPFQTTLQSRRLWEAVDEYRRVYRGLFDDGSTLFPSVHNRGASISERRIGQLVGDITKARLGVRVPVHRVRDCVATEASEELVHGGLLAPALLGHRDEGTAGRYYDHSEGLRAMEALEARVQARQARRPALMIGEERRPPPVSAAPADPS